MRGTGIEYFSTPLRPGDRDLIDPYVNLLRLVQADIRGLNAAEGGFEAKAGPPGQGASGNRRAT